MGWLANDYSQFIAVLDGIRKVYWFFVDQNSEAYPALGGWWLEAYCQQGIANGGSSPQGLHISYLTAIFNKGVGAGRMAVYLQSYGGRWNLVLLSLVIYHQRGLQLGDIQHISQLGQIRGNIFYIVLLMYLVREIGFVIVKEYPRGNGVLGVLVVQGVFYLFAQRREAGGVQYLP